MRTPTWMLALSLSASAAEPPAPRSLEAPRFVPEATRAFALVGPPQAATGCAGPLTPGAPPCRYAAVIGAGALLFTLEALRPAASRLTQASAVPPRDGSPVLRSGAQAPPGLYFSGWSTDATYVGLGAFDMHVPALATP